MKAPLKCYMADHLAGAAVALRLLKSLRAAYGSTEIGLFASELRTEIQADEKVLLDLHRKLDGSSGGWKRALARWFSAVGARKFVRQKPAPFGAFETLETVALGIQGKMSLWRALRLMALPALEGVDFENLLRRAAQQHAAVEELRLSLAKTALTPIS